MIAPAPPPPEVPAVSDVLIIGAGPAGSMAALMAARAGLDVVIVDKARFPRHKVCGCCLSPLAIRLLHEAGLGDELAALCGVKVDRLDLRTGRRRCELRLGSGLAVSRAALDQMLVNAAVHAGARFIDGCKARPGAVIEAARQVQLAHAGTAATCAARVVIAADGLRSDAPGAHTHTDPGSRLGLSAILLQAPPDWADGTILMCWCPHGYVGVTRIDSDRLDIAAALDPAWLRVCGGAHEAVAAVFESCDVAMPHNLGEARFAGTHLLTRRPADVAGHHLLRAGDAAGYVEPFTGEGIAWALASGMAAGRLVAPALHRGWSPRAEGQWRHEHRRLLAHRHRRCRAIALLLRRPALMHLGTRVLRHAPFLADPLIRRIHAPFPLDLPRQTT